LERKRILFHKNLKAIGRLLFVQFLFVVSITSCEQDQPILSPYKTENVIIIVIDGVRYSETWGDSTHQYIPRMANQLLKNGIIYTQFYNDGATYTNPGHTAIITGNYEEIDNTGLELPQYPSIFQQWLFTHNKDNSMAWVIASKDKLEVLSDCIEPTWKGTYNPSTNCGINGLGVGSGHRDDSLTFSKVIDILSKYHPQLVLISFRAPDQWAHQNNWNNYTKGIFDNDENIYKLLQFIENDPFYEGKTTLFVTNDHGRHLDSIADGFISHGDSCEGCRHINLFAYGPDFKRNFITSTKRGLIDIPSTVAELLSFEIPNSKGEVMDELFER